MFKDDFQINEQSNAENVLEHVSKYNFNLYLTYRFRTSIFNANTSFTTSKKQNTNLAIFLCFSMNKPIIFDVLLNNINLLGHDWNHLILCSNTNEKYIKSLTSLINIPIKIKTISSNSVTYNDINNLFLDASFWKKYNEDYIFVYDENTILSQETNTKLTQAIQENTSFVSTSLPFSSYTNSHFYGLSSLRKRNHLITTLENNPQLQIENYGYIEKEIYDILGLQKVPEFVLFSQNNKKTNIKLNSCIFTVNFATTMCNTKKGPFLSKYTLKSQNRKQLDDFCEFFSI